MSFIRKIKKKDTVYLAEVESYRQDGKVKQRVIRYVGKEINGQPSKRIELSNIEITAVKKYLDYRVLHCIAEKLGLPVLLGNDAKFILLLVYTQLITRKAIYKLPEYIEYTALKEILGIDKLADKQLYEALDRLEALDFTNIEAQVFKALSCERKERKAMVLDVTDTYFNGAQADWKARKGKDGKYDKLVQVALAVTQEEGFPILHKTYEGNIGNSKIFGDMLCDIRLKQFDIIVLDRGMISMEAVADMKALNQKVITGLRLHNTIKADYISKIDREEIYQPAYRVRLKNTEVYVKDFDFEGGKLLAIYNPAMETLKRQHAMHNMDTYKPEEAKYMGYSLIYHTTDLSMETAVRIYFEKDVVEKAYRELKSSVHLHPLRKYRISHIQAHVKICYLAYALLAYIQYKVKPKNLSAIHALEQLQAVYKLTLQSEKDNLKWEKVVTLKNEQKAILSLLNCSV
jgi:transposase